MTLSNVTYEKLFKDFLVIGSQMVRTTPKKDFKFGDMLVTMRTNETSIKTNETPKLLLDR